MARKSAAAAKPKAQKPVELTEEQKWEQLEKVFEDAKFTYIETVKVQVKSAQRVDNYLNIRELFDKMKVEASIQRVKDMQKISVQTYEKVLGIAEGFEFDRFVKAECPDPFEDIMPQVADIVVEADEVAAAIRYMSVVPYGNNLVQMHNLIMQEMAKLGLEPKED